ncbi:DNA excision repair protein ERCC-5 [Culicoides brevitarsis]|uniref:DNA excision repair protein ERCC-5 n=1 Tax=Culicoides brevitarsis TaxID=469753 RepID=UPI00307B604C
MGVTGLWKLIEQSGKPVPVETLEGKVLAIDISIWLHQTIKGYQDGKGGAVQNAHLIGLFNRLCKLLFYRIKPVFVFDGGIPQLKRITIAKRSMQRSKTQQEANRVEQVLLEALANEKLVQQALGKSPKDIVSPRKAKQLREAAQKRQEDDLYALPPLENELGVAQLPTELSDDDDEEDNKFLGDLEIAKIDVTHPLFKQLPADKRHAILFELKETRKQSSWGRLHEMPADANNFAEFQMKRLLKRRNVQVSLEEAELEMGGKSLTLMELDQLMREDGIVEGGSDEIKGQRIASNENARFVYIKDTLKAIEESKKTLEEEKIKQNIPEDDVDLQMAIAMSLQNDDPANLAPLPVAKDTDIKLSSPQRANLRDANKGPAREYMLEYGLVNDEVIKDMFQHKEATKTKETDAISITSSTDSDFVDVPEENFSHETIVPMVEPFPLPVASPSKDFRLEDLRKSEVVEVKIDPMAAKVDDLFADIFMENAEMANKRALEDDSDDLNKTQPLDLTEYEHILKGKSPSPNKKLKMDSIEDETDVKKTEVDIKEAENDVKMAENDEHGAEIEVKETEVVTKEDKKDMKEAKIDVKETKTDTKESKTLKNELKTPEKNISLEQKRLEMLKKVENELKMLQNDVKTENKRPEMETSELESPSKKLCLEVSTKIEPETIEILDSQEEKVPDVSIIEPTTPKKAQKSDSYEIIDLLSPKKSPSKVQISPNKVTTKEPVASSSKFVQPPAPTIQNLPEDEEALREMERELAAKSRSLQQEMNKKDRFAVSVTEQMSADCQDLLRMFGIPYIVAPMEAEAECAFLNKHGLVDGIISDDSDVWLFGGSCVYKNFFDNKKIVLEYRAESIKNLFHLDQRTLIQLGMLVGSDYTSGIQGIGTVTAMEVISAFSSNKNDHTDEAISVISALRKFRDWWMNGKECTAPHLTELKKKLKKVSLIEGFPNLDVVKAYLYPEVDLNDEPFTWGMPDVEAILDMTRRKLGWTKSKTEDLLTPVMKKLNEKQMQSSIKNYFKTKEITSHKDLVVSKRTEKSIRRLAGEVSAEKETKTKKRTQKKAKAGPSKEKVEEEVRDESPPRTKSVKYVRPSPKKTPEKKETLRKRVPRIPDPNPVIPQLVKRQEEMEENKKKAAELFKKSKK